MLDQFNRDIHYLRISVTDRCNLRCTYCMPEKGIELIEKDKILSLEEIADVVRIGAAEFGIKKIRFTGGEPLVRKGIVDLIEQVCAIEGIEETTMTTNGILLAENATALKRAGLTRVNISCDSLSPVRFRTVTRGGNIEQVKAGIHAAIEAGLAPIKINVVKTEYTEKGDIEELQEYCRLNNLEIRYIHEMNLETGTFSQVEGGTGGHCEQCNRLRLMSNGDIKPCLFSDLAYNVRELGTRKAFMETMRNKPKEGQALQDLTGKKHHFYNIGG